MLDIIKNSTICPFGLDYSINVASTIITTASSGNIVSAFKGGANRLDKLLDNLGKKLKKITLIESSTCKTSAKLNS